MGEFDLYPHATVYLMEREIVNDNIRGLVVSDMHFTQRLKIAESLPPMLKTLTQIICDKRVNILFVLGDIIEQLHQDAAIADLQIVLQGLDILSVPVYLLPGEHDRALHLRLKGQYTWTNIKVIYESFVCLKNPHPRRGTYPCIFITHSAGNDARMGVNKPRDFIQALKEHFTKAVIEPDEPITDPKGKAPHSHRRPKLQFKNIMTPEDFLLVGSCHKHEQVESDKVASLDQFSIDGKKLFYALITSDGAFHFEFSSLPYAEPKRRQ
jgi:hypothetical protein